MTFAEHVEARVTALRNQHDNLKKYEQYEDVLKPFLRAYAMGVALSIAPKLVGVARRRKDALPELLRGLAGCFKPRGLALVMGVAVGGSGVAQGKLERYVEAWLRRRTVRAGKRVQRDISGGGEKQFAAMLHDENLRKRYAALLATWLNATASSLIAFVLYKGNRSSTLPWTIFLFVRASDSLLRMAYEVLEEGFSISKHRAVRFLIDYGDGLVFWLSSWRIMWCWFYLPDRLPPSYNRWILRLSRTDPNLLSLVKLAHEGRFVYGQRADPYVEELCVKIAQHVDRSPEWTLPHLNHKLDCLFVHGMTGRGSCEVNFAKRWLYGFADAFAIYLPVHLIPQLLFRRRFVLSHVRETFLHVLKGASSSSAFLATFISSIFGIVCLVRTRIGGAVPQLSPQFLESGIAEFLGCMVCGLSVFIENKKRRREMSLYVAPRALTSLIEKSFNSPQLATMKAVLESIFFATSAGTLITLAQHRPEFLSGLIKGVVTIAVGKSRRLNNPKLEQDI